MYYVNEGLNALIRWIGTLYFHVFHALILKLRVGAVEREGEAMREFQVGFGKQSARVLKKLCGHGGSQMK